MVCFECDLPRFPRCENSEISLADLGNFISGVSGQVFLKSVQVVFSCDHLFTPNKPDSVGVTCELLSEYWGRRSPWCWNSLPASTSSKTSKWSTWNACDRQRDHPITFQVIWVTYLVCCCGTESTSNWSLKFQQIFFFPSSYRVLFQGSEVVTSCRGANQNEEVLQGETTIWPSAIMTIWLIWQAVGAQIAVLKIWTGHALFWWVPSVPAWRNTRASFCSPIVNLGAVSGLHAVAAALTFIEAPDSYTTSSQTAESTLSVMRYRARRTVWGLRWLTCCRGVYVKHLSAEAAQEGEGHGITLPSAVGLMYISHSPRPSKISR